MHISQSQITTALQANYFQLYHTGYWPQYRTIGLPHQ